MLRRLVALTLIALSTLPLQTSAQGLAGGSSNDPERQRQWHLAKIGAPCAWEHTTGSSDVLVAVVDTGVDLSHPDLRANLSGSGHDFVDNDDDASDENGHGTNVAGIVAAVINNSEGVAGIAGTVRILPVRVLNAQGSGSSQAIANGVRYAADQGARVINLSLGSLLPVDSEQVVEAIRYARQQGALVVVAAGNSYLPIPNFSFQLQADALIVAATNEQDRKTDFSNYGPWVGVSAPGDTILSTMPTYEVFLTSDAIPPDQRFRQGYDAMSGTSQATPIVAGLAALLFSAHPDWDAARVRQEIETTATDIREHNPAGLVFRPEYLGSGRVNACEAMGGPLSAATANPDEAGLPLALIFALTAALVLVLGGLLLFMRRRQTAQPAAAPAGPPGYPINPQPPGAFPGGPAGPAAGPAPGAAPGSQPPGAAAPWGAPAAGPHASATPGRLIIVQGPEQGRSFLLSAPALMLGRSEGNDIRLMGDASVSRQHARLVRQGGVLLVEDLGSSHGTYINGQRISQPTPLRPGDALHVGHTTLIYEE